MTAMAKRRQPEPERTKALYLQLPTELYERLKVRTSRERRTLKAWAVAAFERELRRASR